MVGIHRLRENEQKMLSDFFRNFDFLGVFFSFFCYFFKNWTNWKKTSKVEILCTFFLDLSFLYYDPTCEMQEKISRPLNWKKTPKKSKFRKKSLCIFRSFSLDLWIPTIHKKSKKMAIPRRGEGGGGTKLSIMHYKKPNKSRMQQVYLK